MLAVAGNIILHNITVKLPSVKNLYTLDVTSVSRNDRSIRASWKLENL